MSLFVMSLYTRKLYVVYGVLPPVAVAVNVTLCPASSIVDVNGAIVTESGALTVSTPVSAELEVTAVVALSVTNTLATSVFPDSPDGIVYTNPLVVVSRFPTRIFVMLLYIRKLYVT